MNSSDHASPPWTGGRESPASNRLPAELSRIPFSAHIASGMGASHHGGDAGTAFFARVFLLFGRLVSGIEDAATTSEPVLVTSNTRVVESSAPSWRPQANAPGSSCAMASQTVLSVSPRSSRDTIWSFV